MGLPRTSIFNISTDISIFRELASCVTFRGIEILENLSLAKSFISQNNGFFVLSNTKKKKCQGICLRLLL